MRPISPRNIKLMTVLLIVAMLVVPISSIMTLQSNTEAAPTGAVTTDGIDYYDNINNGSPYFTDGPHNGSTYVDVRFDKIPNNAGKVFLGWDTSSSATTPEYTTDGLRKINNIGNVKLYAIWATPSNPAMSGDVTISYSGGTYSVSSGGTFTGNAAIIPSVSSLTISSTDPNTPLIILLNGNITNNSGNAIKISSGADVVIQYQSTLTVRSNDKNSAIINVPEGATSTFLGQDGGKLTVIAERNDANRAGSLLGAGIGGNGNDTRYSSSNPAPSTAETSGNITFESGDLTITLKVTGSQTFIVGAAIGGGGAYNNGSGADNEGAYSGTGGEGGTTIINGGSLTINMDAGHSTGTNGFIHSAGIGGGGSGGGYAGFAGSGGNSGRPGGGGYIEINGGIVKVDQKARTYVSGSGIGAGGNGNGTDPPSANNHRFYSQWEGGTIRINGGAIDVTGDVSLDRTGSTLYSAGIGGRICDIIIDGGSIYIDRTPYRSNVTGNDIGIGGRSYDLSQRKVEINGGSIYHTGDLRTGTTPTGAAYTTNLGGKTLVGEVRVPINGAGATDIVSVFVKFSSGSSYRDYNITMSTLGNPSGSLYLYLPIGTATISVEENSSGLVQVSTVTVTTAGTAEGTITNASVDSGTYYRVVSVVGYRDAAIDGTVGGKTASYPPMTSSEVHVKATTNLTTTLTVVSGITNYYTPYDFDDNVKVNGTSASATYSKKSAYSSDVTVNSVTGKVILSLGLVPSDNYWLLDIDSYRKNGGNFVVDDSICTMQIMTSFPSNPLFSGTFNTNVMNVYKGSSVDLSATGVNPYYFMYWDGYVSDPNPNISFPSSNNDDKDLQAYFGKADEFATLNLSVKVDGVDSVTYEKIEYTIGNATFNYQYGIPIRVYLGTDIQIEATPDQSTHRFIKWAGGINSKNPEDTISMNGDKSVTAHFATVDNSVELKLLVNNPAYGKVYYYVENDLFEYDSSMPIYFITGESARLWTEPTPGSYRFYEWNDGLGYVSKEKDSTIGMDTDRTITAYYDLENNLKKLTLSHNGHGELYYKLTEDGEPMPYTEPLYYIAGSTAYIKAVSTDANYLFVEWRVVNSFLDGLAETSVHMDDNLDITAIFEQKTNYRSLKVNIEGTGEVEYSYVGSGGTRTGTMTNSGTLNVLSTSTVSFKAVDDGTSSYNFTNWSDYTNSLTRMVSVPMNDVSSGDTRIITANFQENAKKLELEFFAGTANVGNANVSYTTGLTTFAGSFHSGDWPSSGVNNRPTATIYIPSTVGEVHLSGVSTTTSKFVDWEIPQQGTPPSRNDLNPEVDLTIIDDILVIVSHVHVDLSSQFILNINDVGINNQGDITVTFSFEGVDYVGKFNKATNEVWIPKTVGTFNILASCNPTAACFLYWDENKNIVRELTGISATSGQTLSAVFALSVNVNRVFIDILTYGAGTPIGEGTITISYTIGATTYSGIVKDNSDIAYRFVNIPRTVSEFIATPTGISNTFLFGGIFASTDNPPSDDESANTYTYYADASKELSINSNVRLKMYFTTSSTQQLTVNKEGTGDGTVSFTAYSGRKIQFEMGATMAVLSGEDLTFVQTATNETFVWWKGNWGTKEEMSVLQELDFSMPNKSTTVAAVFTTVTTSDLTVNKTSGLGNVTVQLEVSGTYYDTKFVLGTGFAIPDGTNARLSAGGGTGNFTNWTINTIPDLAPVQNLTISADTDAFANFTSAATYVLTIAFEGTGPTDIGVVEIYANNELRGTIASNDSTLTMSIESGYAVRLVASTSSSNIVFANWKEDRTIVPELKFTMESAITCTAVFGPVGDYKELELKGYLDTNGSVAVSYGTQGSPTDPLYTGVYIIGKPLYIPTGKIVTLDATAEAGNLFLNWSEVQIVLSISPIYDVTMDVSHEIFAAFVSSGYYELSFSNYSSESLRGSILVEYEGYTGIYRGKPIAIPSGETVTLVATPAGGYVFIEWGNEIDSISPKVSFEMTSTIVSTVHFGSATDYWTLTLAFDPDGGEVSVSYGTDFTGKYQIGYPMSISKNSGATLTAESKPTYLFGGWTGGVTSFNETVTVSAQNPGTTVNAEAKFVVPVNTLTLTAGTGGTISFVIGNIQGTVTTGSTRILPVEFEEIVTLTSTSSGSYVFYYWTLSYDATTERWGDTVWDYEMPAKNVTIVANFVTTTLSNLTIFEGGGEVTLTVDGAVTKFTEGKTIRTPVGKSIILTATHSTEDFIGWTGTNESKTLNHVNSTWTFNALSGVTTVTANFASDTYNITVKQTGGGEVTVKINGEPYSFTYGQGFNVSKNDTLVLTAVEADPLTASSPVFIGWKFSNKPTITSMANPLTPDEEEAVVTADFIVYSQTRGVTVNENAKGDILINGGAIAYEPNKEFRVVNNTILTFTVDVSASTDRFYNWIVTSGNDTTYPGDETYKHAVVSETVISVNIGAKETNDRTVTITKITPETNGKIKWSYESGNNTIFGYDTFTVGNDVDVTFSLVESGTNVPNVWTFISDGPSTVTLNDVSPTYKVTGDTTVSLTIKSSAGQVLVTMSPPAGSMITATWLGGYAESSFYVAPGTLVRFNANSETGYKVDEWTFTTTTDSDTGQGETISYTVRADVAVSVTYTQDSPEPVVYNISATADPGAWIDPEGNITVSLGNSKTFHFGALEGYVLSDVIIDGTIHLTQEEIARGQYTFYNVIMNHSIEVKNTRGAFILEVTVEEGEGYVEYSTNGGSTFQRYTTPVSLEEGSSLIVKAIPDSGYHFVMWTGDVQSNDSIISFEDIDSAIELNVFFKENDSSEPFPWWIVALIIILVLLLLLIIILRRRKQEQSE